MSEVQYFCPQCQGMELEIKTSLIIGAGPGEASCKLCGWKGLASDVLGALCPENASFWTTERVANVLLLAASKHAAGPMVQVLELLGIVPKVSGSEEEQASARNIREYVMKSVLEAITTASFEAAALLVPEHHKRFDPELAEASEHIFTYGAGADDRA